MNEKQVVDLAGFNSFFENWQAAQKRFIPSGKVLSQLAETVHTISQAQITYNQTVMRANAALLAVLWALPVIKDAQDHNNIGERPSKAAHRPDVSAQ